MSDFIPNSFQVPNILIDKILPVLKPTQFACLMLIIRKTKGWQKTHDYISISTFLNYCGSVDKRTVYKALSALEYSGLITINRKRGRLSRYSLNDIFTKPVAKNDTTQVVANIVTGLVTLNVPTSDKSSDIKCTPTKERNKKTIGALARDISKNGKPSNGPPTSQQVIEAGQKLGLTRKHGESLADFKARIQVEYSRSKFNELQS